MLLCGSRCDPFYTSIPLPNFTAVTNNHSRPPSLLSRSGLETPLCFLFFTPPSINVSFRHATMICFEKDGTLSSSFFVVESLLSLRIFDRLPASVSAHAAVSFARLAGWFFFYFFLSRDQFAVDETSLFLITTRSLIACGLCSISLVWKTHSHPVIGRRPFGMCPLFFAPPSSKEPSRNS